VKEEEEEVVDAENESNGSRECLWVEAVAVATTKGSVFQEEEKQEAFQCTIHDE
jgi:hypothetical protein